MWVKICGTTNLPDALLAIQHGADALGFIFAPSKRRVTIAEAAAITSQIGSGIERVGIFTLPDVSEIVDTVAAVHLSAVQLHLPHDSAFTAALRRQLGPEIRLLQVVGLRTEAAGDLVSGPTFSADDLQKLQAAFSDPALWAVLLDAERGGQSGGLGIPFSWAAAQALLQKVSVPPQGTNLDEEQRNASKPKLLLAGGLNAANVEEAIQMLQPWGVDCVSGVEAEPGRKDPARLTDFLKAARFQSLSTLRAPTK